jgi:hypothetical protein
MKSSLNDRPIREATLEDEGEIKHLLLAAFKESEGLHLPLKPTKKNVDNFFALEVRPALINQDPAYLVSAGPFDSPSVSIAFSCCSTCLNSVYDLDKRIAVGVITIIAKTYRNQGLATELHAKILGGLRDKDIEFVLTDISTSNKPSFNSCLNIVKKAQLDYNVISSKYECRI